MSDLIVSAVLGTTEEEGEGEVVYTSRTEVDIDAVALVITTSYMTTLRGVEVERDKESVLLYFAEMDRLIELYQQYRKEHEA